MTARRHAWLTCCVTLAIAAAGCAEPDPSDPADTAEPVVPAGSQSPPGPQPSTPGPASPSPSASPTPQAAQAPATPPAVENPAEAAALLTEAEAAIRDPATPDDELARWARVQQATYRQVADQPEWHDAVLEAVPTDLTLAASHNLEATIQLRQLTSPRPALPDWRIVAPPPASELMDAYRQAEQETGVDWSYLAAIHLVETRMGRIRGVSTAGAQGPMQFLPSTWDAYGEGDITDPHDAIAAAARYLIAHGAPQDMDAALWAYNHSDRYVAAIKAHAAVMRQEPRTYRAYHAWQVYYRLESGDVILPVGWEAGDDPVPAPGS